MLDSVVAFADDLREAGIPVSISEVLDAIAAVEAAGMDSRSLFRTSLRTTMVKRSEQLALFDALFDAHFGSPAPIEDVRELSVSEMQDALGAALESGDEQALAVTAREAVAQFAGIIPGRFLGVDYHVRRVMRQLDVSTGIAVAPETDFEEYVADYDERERADRLKQAVTVEVWRQGAKDRGRKRVLRDAISKAPDHLDFLRATPREVADMDKLARSLGHKLAARLRRQRRHGHSGRLRVGPTVRRSLSTGGVPFDPVLTKRTPHRPSIVVLADVSGSVATFARFTLQLLHALSGQFARVRTFVFVDEVDEVTQWFSSANDFDTAMSLINGSAHTVGSEGHSDYGKVFSDFMAEWGREVTSSTTVIVLGDARNNYHPVNAAVLADLNKRARKVYWLNPEPKSYWDSADSVISQYAQHCDGVYEARNLQQLASAVEKLS